MSRLLFIVDVQHDFVSGSLAVPDAREAIEVIERLIDDGGYDHIWASKDWHPTNHVSFAEAPLFIDGSWPRHCVAFTEGAEFASSKIAKAVQRTFYKGVEGEAYSAWEGVDVSGVSLSDALKPLDEEIGQLDVVGLATDYCVKATAIDLATNLWYPRVILSATRPVDPLTGMYAVADLVRAGVDYL